MLWVKLLVIFLSLLLILTWLWIFLRKPNGILKIDEYLDKDLYLMMWLTALPELKKHKKLLLEVQVEEHNELYIQDDVPAKEDREWKSMR